MNKLVPVVHELLAALKAERQRVADWRSRYEKAAALANFKVRQLEAAEAEVERITAITKREADLHNERQIRLQNAEAKLHEYETEIIPELQLSLGEAQAKLAEAHSDYARWKADWVSVSKHGDARLEAAEATLTRVKGLIPKWKEGDFDLPDYTRGKIDGRHECAKELRTVLEKDDE